MNGCTKVDKLDLWRQEIQYKLVTENRIKGTGIEIVVQKTGLKGLGSRFLFIALINSENWPQTTIFLSSQ